MAHQFKNIKTLATFPQDPRVNITLDALLPLAAVLLMAGA